MSMIEFRSVCKEYHGRQVIDTLSLKIEAKERVVLFGPSGCGKSSLIRLDAQNPLFKERSREAEMVVRAVSQIVNSTATAASRIKANIEAAQAKRRNGLQRN